MPSPFREAASRSYHDAEHLYADGRLGSADHFYGIACECALKAILVGLRIIVASPPQKPFKVHINGLWGEYCTALTGRSGSALQLGSNPFGAWRVDHRYEDDALFTSARVASHRHGAAEGLAVLQEAMLQGIVI